MKSNLSMRIFSELTRKGYRVEDASSDNIDDLRVLVYLNNSNASMWIDLVIPLGDNVAVGHAMVYGLKAITQEKRALALEYINSINQKCYLNFILNENNQIAIQNGLFSSSNNLFEQYISFVEFFSFFFMGEMSARDINSLLSL